MTRPTPCRFLALILAVLVMSLLAACNGGDGGSDNPKSTTKVKKYVALGDSFVSGFGIATSTGACGRSDHNYPSLLSAALGVKHFVDVSCGGATTSDIVSSQPRFDGARLAPQINAVTADADLVTVGIGGNDGHLLPVLYSACFTAPTNAPATCQAALAGFASVLPTTRARVTAALDRIKTQAPHAEVVLVGYLRLMPDSGTCDAAAVPIAEPEISAAAKVEGDLDETLRQAATDANVTFVSMRAASTGHDACAGANAWVNGVTSTGDGAVLHPRAVGAEATAKAVQNALKAG